MALHKIPKYSKVELLFKESKNNNLNSTTKLEFDDCGLMITGDYIVVVQDQTNINNHMGQHQVLLVKFFI